MKTAKKLIEVALPLEAINTASAREKSIRHGHPSTLHLWWARRPLAAARALIFAQMVDDPSSHPSSFPTEEMQEKERQRLFRLIERLVQWENTTNEEIVDEARQEIWNSWRLTCEERKDYPSQKELFNPAKLPIFYDPFAGGGSLPLEAQRLGLEASASDLNPVAVLITKAMIEIPPKFAGKSPVNPDAQKQKTQMSKTWQNAQGLAEDVRYYGHWIRNEAEQRLAHLYPKVEITTEMAKLRPDLERYIGRQLMVIAWLWARTVRSPNPAFASVDVPLVSSFVLCSKPGKEAYVEPMIDSNGYHFLVKMGKPKQSQPGIDGTKLGRGASFRCLMSGTPIAQDHIRAEFNAKRAGHRLLAIVAEGENGRVYLTPTAEHETLARRATPEWKPEVEMNQDSKDLLSGRGYGFKYWYELFTPRQLVALTTISDLIQKAIEQVKRDAIAAGVPDDGKTLEANGTGATAYSQAVGVYLGFCLDKATLTNTTQATWQKAPDRLTQAFGRQAIPMIWDYAEANPLSEAGGGFGITAHAVAKVLERLPNDPITGTAFQLDATKISATGNRVVSTDPPYYDNIGYAELSEYFYVWLRRTLRPIFPALFTTLATPKADELVATPYRHGGKEAAETFFLTGMTQAMRQLVGAAHPSFPVTIYYAFKQSESDTEAGTASTGWETFLDAVISAGFSVSGTWPIRTELIGNLKKDVSALASSIVLVCRPRAASAPTVTRREFVISLKTELPVALLHLQRSNIAPVDLAQAAIGPGMAVYTKYAKVLDAGGEPLRVREALALINETLDEVLAKQEGDFDADTRWALAWFDQSGFEEAEYGLAETLSKAKNTSVSGMVDAGIIRSKSGKVRLLRPDELMPNWNPDTDKRLTTWETVHQLIRALSAGGENAAAELVAKLGMKAEVARELAYRLYQICERKKRAQEALAYNSLVQSWPEITRLASERRLTPIEQSALF